MRRSHHHIDPPQVQYCPQCENAVLPHRVCSNCGYYQGREIQPDKPSKTEK
jgi:large subunit ribosomal protein L32